MQSKLQYMGLCCSAGFDIGEAPRCFDSFQTVMEGKEWGRREKETGKGVGVEVGVAEKESGLLNVTLGRTAGKMQGDGEVRRTSLSV